MKRILFVLPVLLLLTAFAVPHLAAQQQGRGSRRGQGQQGQLQKRDGSCTTPGQGKGRGQGIRKQDGTGPRAGTAACPKTPKAPAK